MDNVGHIGHHYLGHNDKKDVTDDTDGDACGNIDDAKNDGVDADDEDGSGKVG